MRLPLTILLIILITPANAGVISIVIDDLGYSQTLADQAIELPAGITLSVLPATPYADVIMQQAAKQGHEVMLHLPMQANQEAPEEPNTFTLSMSEQELKLQLDEYLHRYPEIAGVNNHMGSRMTSSTQSMNWLMQSLANKPDVFFLDSRTTKNTVAESTAAAYSIPTTRRDVFLDNPPASYNNILKQLVLLTEQARSKGFALAIGHPNPLTLEVLRIELPKLMTGDIELAPVSEYIRRQKLKEQQTATNEQN